MKTIRLALVPMLTILPAVAASMPPVPVFVELFTSEGCSSCPPADQVLQWLDRQPIPGAHVIVLSEHVDYWNYLGWRDPYSSSVFSDRQKRYSDRFGSTVYTPQMVVNGETQVLGSDSREVTGAITRAMSQPSLALSIGATRTAGGAKIHIEANPGGGKADLWLVSAQNSAQSSVARGENSGRTLTHVAVAKSFVRIGKWPASGNDFTLTAAQLTPKPGETRIIALVADPRTGRILGAAETEI
ncbi:MAG TPA: DUF1223 domain-containing protein [Bryobacteraceae bacterium]|nr:DUF1223 domain-containing protein [Bryobacteraceae bacterium]